jgi:hypothetical protein
MQKTKRFKSLMKQKVIRKFPLAAVMLIVSACSNNPFIHSFGNQHYPGKEIQVNNGRFDKPYQILGPVEYTLKKNTSIFVSQIELRNQAIDYLKQDAVARYGERVDAIIDFQVKERATENSDERLNFTHVQGLAIAFLPEIKPISRHKPKYKPKVSSKIKQPKGDSGKTEEVEITPAELLK